MDQDVSRFPTGSLAARLLALPRPSQVTRRTVAKADSVFRQGDPASAVFLVEAGRVRLVRSLEDGTTVTLHVAEAGESFAEASLSASRYYCDAVAETDAVVIALPKAGLLAALAADPAESLALAVALATQVRDLRARLELRNIKSAAARVLVWLRLHATGNPPVVALRRPWTLIAEELGLTRGGLPRPGGTRAARPYRPRHRNGVSAAVSSPVSTWAVMSALRDLPAFR